MKTMISLLAAAIFAAVCNAQFVSFRINPVDDGSIYGLETGNVVIRDGYVLASGSIRGAMVFEAPKVSFSTISLALNPYGLPVWDLAVKVYGYATSLSTIQAGDYNKGTFLGTLHIAQNIGFGQDSLLDVTDFVKSVSSTSSYFGFTLVTNGTDVFSSLEYNLGHPSGLVGFTPVPEPSTNMLMAFGLGLVLCVVMWPRRDKHIFP